MKQLLYILLFFLLLAMEIITAYALNLIFQHPHKHSFYVGCGFVIAFVLLNCELIRVSIKYIDQK